MTRLEKMSFRAVGGGGGGGGIFCVASCIIALKVRAESSRFIGVGRSLVFVAALFLGGAGVAAFFPARAGLFFSSTFSVAGVFIRIIRVLIYKIHGNHCVYSLHSRVDFHFSDSRWVA